MNSKPLANKIDHLGIAVRNLQEHMNFYQNVLGLQLVEIEEVPEQQVRTAIFQVGESRIELLESTSEEGPIAQHIAKRGEGLAHIALGVDDTEEAIHKLQQNNIRMIDESPRQGAGEAKIAFAHPKSTQGLLFEFCERQMH
jgi:methylmalonyl-CoA epimerase